MEEEEEEEEFVKKKEDHHPLQNRIPQGIQDMSPTE